MCTPKWDETVFTADGFLKDRQIWTKNLACHIAVNVGISLTDEHWLVIDGVRKFYDRTGLSPTMRPLVRIVRNEVDPALGSSLALIRMFGQKTTRYVAMLSGLPKPSDCI